MAEAAVERELELRREQEKSKREEKTEAATADVKAIEPTLLPAQSLPPFGRRGEEDDDDGGDASAFKKRRGTASFGQQAVNTRSPSAARSDQQGSDGALPRQNDQESSSDPLESYLRTIGPEESEDEMVSVMAGLNRGSALNPFGSNFITLDDIMGGGRGASSDRERSSSMTGSEYGNESEGEREERELREKKQFMEALRAARMQQESVFQSRGDGVIAKPDLGRVYASEGDVVDEMESKETTRKTALEVLEEQKKGKELKPVDHNKVDYLPFRKNLYIVPRVLNKLSEDAITERREDLQIKVRGKGCPVPVDTWEQCGLSDRILQQLQKLNLSSPFAIQKQAIPAIMCGRDVIGVAKTGSGKTLAFLLPMFRHIMDQPPLRDLEGPIGLVMAPARELAFQIFSECKKFTKVLGLRCGCLYGGAGVAEQIADLKRGMEIAVCTPGRLIDILCMQAGKLMSLKRVTMVVMDEADRMFDMGFEPQIKMILQNVRPDRQTILFSATFPKQIESLARKVLKFPLEIVVGDQASGTVNKDITQIVEVHEENEKFLRLLQLLGVWYEKGSVLVFVDKQEKCDQLFQDLLTSGYPCLSLHGGKDQVDRDHTLHEFKTGIKTVLVATSVAGRGLDVPEVCCVINFNTPNHVEDYVHRVGRTGRAGRKGTAYTFVSPQEDHYASVCIKVLERAGVEVPAEVRDMYSAYCQKVDRGEAKAVHSNSGFSGKGFTFDAEEMNESQKIQALQKKAYEREQGIVNPAADDDELAGGGGGGDDGEAGGSTSVLPGAAGLTPLLAFMLEKAKTTASLISAKKTTLALPVATTGLNASASTSTSTSTLPCTLPDGSIDTKAAVLRAKAIWTEVLRARLGGGGAGGGSGGAGGVGAEGAVAGAEDAAGPHFSEEFDINDYPPLARRKITQKATIDDVIERASVNIIQRGNYVPPNKKPELGEKRLHLFIEGSSELAVKKAKAELLRLLEEETLKGVTGAGAGAGGAGRYSVL